MLPMYSAEDKKRHLDELKRDVSVTMLLHSSKDTQIIPENIGKGNSEMNREQWLQARTKGIGSSDVAAVLGLSPYKTNVELWEEKMGLRKPKDISDVEYVQNGTNSEDPLRKLFAVDYPDLEIRHVENGMMIHPKYDFIRCSPDGILVEKETGRLGFLEIKRCEIASGQAYLKWKDGAIPDYYYTQTLQYFLANPKIQFGYLRAYLIRHMADGSIFREIRDYKIADTREEVEEDLKYLLPKEIEFWECVKQRRRPALILPII